MAITLVSLFMVSCRNPGLVERKTAQDPSSNAFLWNEQVGSYRPPDALYCRECQVLIEGAYEEAKFICLPVRIYFSTMTLTSYLS
jgi:hypothetical protein